MSYLIRWKILTSKETSIHHFTVNYYHYLQFNMEDKRNWSFFSYSPRYPQFFFFKHRKSAFGSFVFLIFCLENLYSTLLRACIIASQVRFCYQRHPKSLCLKELLLVIYIPSLWHEPFYILPCIFCSLKYLVLTLFTESKLHCTTHTGIYYTYKSAFYMKGFIFNKIY